MFGSRITRTRLVVSLGLLLGLGGLVGCDKGGTGGAGNAPPTFRRARFFNASATPVTRFKLTRVTPGSMTVLWDHATQVMPDGAQNDHDYSNWPPATAKNADTLRVEIWVDVDPDPNTVNEKILQDATAPNNYYFTLATGTPDTDLFEDLVIVLDDYWDGGNYYEVLLHGLHGTAPYPLTAASAELKAQAVAPPPP